MSSGRMLVAVWVMAQTVSFLSGVSAVAAEEAYRFDKEHTSITAFYDHLGLSRQSLRFSDFEGKIEFDVKEPEETRASITIQAASVTSLIDGFDKKLRGKGYFNADKHPQITFVTRSAKRTGKNTGQIFGDLTINGITKPAVFDVEYRYSGRHPLSGMLDKYKAYDVAAFRATSRVLRSEFDMGGFAPLVSDAVDIVVEMELLKRTQ